MAALREIFARFGVAFETGPLARGEAQIQKVTAALGTFGIALGGAAIVHGVTNFIGGIREAGDELDKTSIILGVQTGQLQAWRHAAGLAGVGEQDFSNALIRLQRQMGDANNGMATAQDEFRRLGLSVTDAGGELRGVGDFLPDFADSIAAIESPSARVAALNTLMGRSGARLAPLFTSGAAGLAAMREEFERLGGGLSQETIDAAVRLTDAQTRLSTAFDGVRSRIGLFLLPALERLTNALTGLLSNRRKMEAFTDTLKVLAAVLTVKLLPALSALAVRSAAVLAVWAPLLVAGAVLYLVLEDIKTALEGGDSLFGDWTDAINDFTEANKNAEGPLGAIAQTWRWLIRRMEEGFAIMDAILHWDSRRLDSFLERRARDDGLDRRRGDFAGGVGINAQGQARLLRRPGGGGGAPNVTIQNNQQITGDSPAEIARQVERANRRTNREAVEALEGRYASAIFGGQ